LPAGRDARRTGRAGRGRPGAAAGRGPRGRPRGRTGDQPGAEEGLAADLGPPADRRDGDRPGLIPALASGARGASPNGEAGFDRRRGIGAQEWRTNMEVAMRGLLLGVSLALAVTAAQAQEPSGPIQLEAPTTEAQTAETPTAGATAIDAVRVLYDLPTAPRRNLAQYFAPDIAEALEADLA